MDEVLETIRRILVERFRIPSSAVTPAATFRGQLGFDSIDVVDFIVELETAFQIEQPIEDLTNVNTVGDVANIVCDLRDRDHRPEAALRPRTLIDFYRVASEVHDRGITLLDEKASTQKTYAEIMADARRLASTLSSFLSSGELVLVVLPTSFEFIQAFLALQLIGAVPVPCYPPPPLHQIDVAVERLAGIVERTGAKVCITDSRTKRQLLSAELNVPQILSTDDLTPAPNLFPWREVSPSDMAFVQCSSGATTNPKGVSLSHRALVAHVTQSAKHVEPDPERDTIVSWLPLYHDLGLVAFFLSGICWTLPVVLIPTSAFLRRPGLWLEALDRHHGTLTGAPPLGYAVAVQRAHPNRPLSLGQVRISLCGADWINFDVLDAFLAKFGAHGFRPQALRACYGLAENTVGVTMGELADAMPRERVDAALLERGEAMVVAEGAATPAKVVASVGIALPQCELSIVGPDGRALPDGHVGEIVVRSPWLMDGYYRDPVATQAVLDGGRLRTGDLGYTRSGRLFMTGRAKDMMKIRGRNCYAVDLENIAEAVEGVRTAGAIAFAVDGGELGDEAVVVCESAVAPEKRPALAAAIHAAILERLEVRVKEIVIVGQSANPKTPSGKKQRLLCRTRYLEQALATSPRPPPSMEGPSESRRAGIAHILRDAPDDVRAESITSQNIVWLVEAKSDQAQLPAWFERHRALIDERLRRHGAVLFRGFACSADDFAAVARVVSPRAKDYQGGNTPRTLVAPDVYTASELPANLVLPQHHEMMITHCWPMKLLFYCEVAASRGGETPLCGAQSFLNHVSPRLLESFRRRGGIAYVRNYRTDIPFRSLAETFGTESPEKIEAICRRDDIELEWKGEGWLQTRQVRPAFRTHPNVPTDAFVATPHIWHPECWLPEMRQFGANPDALRAAFEQDPNAAWMFCTYADGTPIEASVAREIGEVFERLKEAIPWQPRDVLLVDNLLVSHGRNAYEGRRRILAALREPYDARYGFVT